MIEVYRIPIPKDRLLALPKDERVLLLLLGYAANQVLMFEKILMFATKVTPEAELEQHATGVQTQMLVRLAVGAVFEALLLVERQFLSSPLGKEYPRLLDAGGVQALENIKKLLSKSMLLSAVRNNFGFHFPKPESVEDAFQAAIADSRLDDMWKVYFSHHSFNSLFLLSDMVYVHGIATKVGAEDILTLQQQLMNELREGALNVVTFAQAFFAAVWLKHFGTWIDAEDIVKIVDAPLIDEISLPFFVEIPRSEE